MTIVCPTPLVTSDCVQLGHGSGGKMSASLIRERFLPLLGNEILAQLGDAAIVHSGGQSLAISTDTFVVQPLEFPGGNIGSLAVHGTANDLAMMGARPEWLTTGFVLEEGLSFDVLDRVVRSMAAAAHAAGVLLVAGDTKVVERGKADGMYINTTGVGVRPPGFAPTPARAQSADTVIVSGPIGRHGIAIMTARESLAFEAEVTSDSAVLTPLVDALRRVAAGSIHTLRDPTRGGLASALNEIAQAAGIGIVLDEGRLPVPDPVAAACEMLGLDPLYVASEGILVAVVSPDVAEACVAALRRHPLGRMAATIGRCVREHPGIVALDTRIGGTRVVDMLPGDQLPRIC